MLNDLLGDGILPLIATCSKKECRWPLQACASLDIAKAGLVVNQLRDVGALGAVVDAAVPSHRVVGRERSQLTSA